MTTLDKQSLWESVLAELQLSLSGANFQTWFKGKTAIVAIDQGLIEIGCANAYNKVWIEERYLGKIKEIIDKLTGENFNVLCRVSTETWPAKTTSEKVKEEKAIPLFEEVASSSIKESVDLANINQGYSFSNFIVGQSNQLAYAVAKSVVENPSDLYNPLLICGGVGVGKTHLLQAIGQALIMRREKSKVLYTTSETFTNDMVEAIQKKQTISFRSKYRDVDLLLIDDIQFVAGRESTQEEFFHTFNHLYSKGKQIVLSSDRPPGELANLQERLKNRFLGGMIARIEPPDLELREAILLAKAKLLRIGIDFTIIRRLAEVLGPSIRELEGGLSRLLAVANLTGKSIDLPLVETVIGLENKKDRSLEDVIGEVATFFSLTAADLKGKRRGKECVFPRQVAMFLLRKELGLSFKEIAASLGGKDHTTAIYSVSKVENLVEKGGEVARVAQEVRDKVFGS